MEVFIMENNYEYYFVSDIETYIRLADLGVYPVTYRDGAWIYEMNGKLKLALNTLREKFN